MPISVSFYIFLQLINFNFSLLNLFSDATFKIADKVKRRKKNESIIETTNFKQTLIISTKTTKRDENNRVCTRTVPKAYIHMDSKKLQTTKKYSMSFSRYTRTILTKLQSQHLVSFYFLFFIQKYFKQILNLSFSQSCNGLRNRPS